MPIKLVKFNHDPIWQTRYYPRDLDAVRDVLTSDFLTQGPKVPKFEKIVSEHCGANHAVAVNSATSALHIACLALGLKKGDYLWTSPISFVASANCGRYCGAKIDFVDIDPKTYNMSINSLEENLKKAKKNNCLPKIVVPVHLGGQSCDMRAIHGFLRSINLRLLKMPHMQLGGNI